MSRFGSFDLPSVGPYKIDCWRDGTLLTGEVFHVRRHSAASGTISTPVAQVFVWHPPPKDGYNEYWRVDCYLRIHDLAPDPETLARAVAKELLASGLCDEPLWLSWHESREIAGAAYGEVYDGD